MTILSAGVLAAADACTAIFSLCIDIGTVGDIDLAAVTVLTAADTCRIRAAVGFDGRIFNSYSPAVCMVAAADACRIAAAVRRDVGMFEGDIAAVTALTAADACAVGLAVGFFNGRVGNVDGAAADRIAAADTCAVASAVGCYG